MESLDLDESIKREAFLIAKGRQEVADKIKRPEGLFHDYDPLEANWQGAIAEVFLKRMFPSLLLSQPYVVESDKTTECDFILEKEGIEVKCNRFHSIYPVFFVNKTRFLKKFDHTRKVVCCAINDSPSKASKFYIFGWLEAAKVKEYPVETRYSSPAYAVPIKDFLPMDKLFENLLWHTRRDRLSSNQHQEPTKPVHGDLEMSLPLNQVVLGDCVEVMTEWPENSVDTIVTDPPYGISFMGKEWDRALPPRAAFSQMIRVLKPGALAFVMSSPRQDVLWRMLALLEGVGFELRQSFVSWVYKSGFPKAFDVSKGIDRRLRGDLIRSKVNYFTNKRGLSLKELAEKLDIPDAKKTLWDWLFDGHSPSNKNWLKVKEVLDVSDEEEKQFEREIIGKRRNERNMPLPTLYDGDRIDLDITAPATDLARQWEGWKSQTGLKPALECILMVNKPRSEPTIVDNVLRWGTGAVNVDACRIPFQSEEDIGDSERFRRYKGEILPVDNGWNQHNMNRQSSSPVGTKGRFPANLIISDGALDTGETTKSVRSKRGGWIPSGTEIYQGNIEQGRFSKDEAYEAGYDDEGSPFRFFDLDAWAEHHGFLDVAKPSKTERDFGLTTQPLQVPKSKFNLNDGSKDMRFDGVIPTPRRNTHPTCKPVKLMAYLIELGCPPKGIVVDPFLGSGTTCIAAKRLRRQWIGIEINPEYAEIAEARINIRGPLDQFMEAESNG